MTAGYGVNDGNTYNPLPQAGTYGGNPAWAPYRIGFIRNIPGALPGNNIFGTQSVYALYFIFNPNQVVSQFQLNSGSTPPLFLYGSGGSLSSQQAVSNVNTDYSTNNVTDVPNLTQSQSVTWSLLFDRTYDMLYDTNPGENRGVLRDTAALYNMMGTFTNTGAVPISTPCQVVFGQTSSGQLWGFTGYISGVTITYGIFRANMIPSRAEVDLTLTCTYVAPATPATGGGTSTTGGSSSTTNTVAGVPGTGLLNTIAAGTPLV
jgi:hypothetical protein